ncbi:MAG: PTS IIA-like nitrogen regulatory protein PtsN [Pseudomonadota bacterium]
MDLNELLKPEAVLPALKAAGKKQAFQDASARLGDLYGLAPRRVCEGLLAREHLGSTGMGNGVAIPHARVEGMTRIGGLFARLATPIAFDAADGKGVDLMFFLLAPEEAGADHLRALARVSRLMRDGELRAKLRQTPTAAALHALLTEPSNARAA